jgi:hypothetical protein
MHLMFVYINEVMKNTSVKKLRFNWHAEQNLSSSEIQMQDFKG